MAQLDVSSLRWTNDLNMRHFIAEYRRQLPQLLRTTSGFSDASSIHDIGQDETFVIFDIQEQKRVIATTDSNRFVSIPLNSQLPVHRLLKRMCASGEVTSLEQLSATEGLDGQWVQVACKTTLFDFSTDGNCAETLVRFRLLDTYNEIYLTGRTLYDGKLNDTTIGIPVYLPITVQVAMDLSSRRINELFGASLSKTYISVLSEELLVFDERPQGDYAYINPLKYARSSVSLGYSSPSHNPSGPRDTKQHALVPTTHRPNRHRDPSPTSNNARRIDDEEDSSSDYEQIYDNDDDNDYERPTLNVRRSATLPARVPPVGCQGSNGSLDGKPPPLVKHQPPLSVRRPTRKAPPVVSPKPSSSSALQRSPRAITPDGGASIPVKDRKTPLRRPPPDIPSATMARPTMVTRATTKMSEMSVVGGSKTPPVPTQVVSPTAVTPKGSSPGQLRPTDCTMWQTLDDVPHNVENFSVEQLHEALQLLRMPNLASLFKDQLVDGPLLTSIITEESLIKDFQCSVFEAKKLIQFTKHNWRPKH